MRNRFVVFLVFTFMLLVAGSQQLSAQTLFNRLFKNSDKTVTRKSRITARQKNKSCGDMPAYNKPKAFKKHKASRKWGSKPQPEPKLTKRVTKRLERDTSAVAKRTRPPGNPPQNRTSTKTPPLKPGSRPPTHKTNTDKPGSNTEQPPIVAKANPVVPKHKDSTVVVKRNVKLLTREQLKKMTIEERRDTLEKIPPTIVLPPIQFISDQDEFSVVNMDSFMQALEYAQQGKVVLIEGHTDDLGSDAYNLKLSMKRAEKIRQLLLSGDVGDELISVIGYGERQPLVPNTSDANRSINRRIEFKIFSLPEE